ncbi:MAG: hypothetical protein IAC42_01620 [Spirochaetes bacterium]|uniref:Uncharacterized protein n=1 Tax=Candidatus Aphodenecus pullistercoris TaxID=2840669 RepID=A0A9D9EBX2_9SPIR|nr:hypothetical protein [Candidatus Aphodenecus pullistercoris]
MKTRTGKIYTSIIYAIILALYLILFIAFVPRPYSSQKTFFLVLVPLIILVNYGINMVEMSFRHVESVLTTFTASVIVQAAYTVLSLLLAAILAVVGVSMKTQIVIQVVTFLVAGIGFAVTLFTASAAKDVRKGQTNIDRKAILRKDFGSVLVEMESKGLSGEALDSLKSLAEDYRHMAPCNDPSAMALEDDIHEELAAMVADGCQNVDAHISKIRFLMKRRSLLKSR